MSEHCPVCLANNTTPYSMEKWDFDGVTYHLDLCNECRSAYTKPNPTDSTLEKLYRTSFNYRWYLDHYKTKLQDCRMRVQELGAFLGKRVLDFGGGMGYFSKAASEAGLESITYDPYVSSDLPSENNWDSVVALHVLEHSNDLDRTVTQISKFLAPGGRLIVAVPNFSSLGYQKHGMRWVWAQPPLVHVFHFTAAGLVALLSRHGFADIRVSYHERWDANRYCDVEYAKQFRKWDAAWGMRPFRAFPLYRRLIAYLNSRRRFRGLEESLRNYDSTSDISAELQITAVLERP